jgi:hypothetical protein
MKERYPCLVYWMKTGVRKFPEFPPKKLDQLISTHALRIYQKAWGIEDTSLEVYVRLQEEGVVSKAFVEAVIDLGLENDEDLLGRFFEPYVSNRQSGRAKIRKRR